MANESKQTSGDGFDGKDSSKRLTSEGFESWPDYWKAQGMPWRTEPEIGVERQQHLKDRLAIKADIEQGIYPFKDEHLERRDVEWLLTTHLTRDGKTGPVDWNDPKQRDRTGLDLRGAILTGEDLHSLPLANLLGGLSGQDFDKVSADVTTREFKLDMAAIHLERANLGDAQLQGSALVSARLESVELRRARLEAADMYGVHFDSTIPADLTGCYMDHETSFRNVHLKNPTGIGPRLRRVHWGEAALGGYDWTAIKMLADEKDARSRTIDGKRSGTPRRLLDCERAISANQLLSNTLRNQGYREAADKYSYRVQLCRRLEARLRRKYGAYFGSLFLGLISGYGYKPMRSIITYLVVTLSFAAAYFALTNFAITPFLPSHSSPLVWYEAIVLSISSFHGRGLFPSGLSLVLQPQIQQCCMHGMAEGSPYFGNRIAAVRCFRLRALTNLGGGKAPA